MTVEKPKEKFGHLNPATSALFICDIQEKFEKSIELFEMVVTNVERMVQVANILKILTVNTEQYPQVSHVFSRKNLICIQIVLEFGNLSLSSLSENKHNYFLKYRDLAQLYQKFEDTFNQTPLVKLNFLWSLMKLSNG